MALTFSYKILDASGNSLNEQIIEVANNGSAVDQARQYRLGLYAAYSGLDINLVSSDITLSFKDYLVSAAKAGESSVEFSSDLGLFRSAAIASTNGRVINDSFTTIEKRTLSLSLNRPVAEVEAKARYYASKYQDIFDGDQTVKISQRNATLGAARDRAALEVFNNNYNSARHAWQLNVEKRLNSHYRDIRREADKVEFEIWDMDNLVRRVQNSVDLDYDVIRSLSRDFIRSRVDDGSNSARDKFSNSLANWVVQEVTELASGSSSVRVFLDNIAETARLGYINSNPIDISAPLADSILVGIALAADRGALEYVAGRLASDIVSGEVNSYQSTGLWALNGSPLGFNAEKYVEQLDDKLVLKSEYYNDLAFVNGIASFAFDESIVTAELVGTVGTLDQVRFSQGAAAQLGGQLGDGLLLGSEQGERFLGSVLLDINDSFFQDGSSYSANTLKNTLSDYLAFSLNQDETILVSDRDVEKPDQIRSIRDLGGYSFDASSLPAIESVSGSFLVDASLQGKLGTTLETTSQSGRFTNLLRAGQKLTTHIDIFNDGKAGLQDVAFELNTPALSKYNLDSVTAQHGRADWSSAASPSFTAGENIEITTALSAGLGAIDRSRNSAGFLDKSADDAVRIRLNLTVSGEAGEVATFSSNGGISLSARGVALQQSTPDAGSVKNLITYQGDLNYDGKVGMRDLAALNEGARLAAGAGSGGVANADVDANFDGQIDIDDLAALAKDWGRSLWSETDNGSQFLGEGTGDNQITAAQLGAQNSIEWDNTPFTLEGTLVAGRDVVAAQGTFADNSIIAPSQY